MSDEKNTEVAFKRYLGFRHRVKVRVVDGEPTEPLPSTVAITDADGVSLGQLELPSEQAELDFIKGILPVKYRVPLPNEDISNIKRWQVVWRAPKDDEALIERNLTQCRFKTKRGKKGEAGTQELIEVVKEIPCEWTGLQANDALAMCLGGSGDYFALATANRLHKMGGEIFRIPPFKLQAHRDEGEGSKDDDALLLTKLVRVSFEDFYPTIVRDKKIIHVRESYKLRTDAMKDRMACAQRLRQHLIGTIFCSEDGLFPDGDIEKRYEELTTLDSSEGGDPIYRAILEQEKKAFEAMEEAVKETDVWKNLFANFPGVGPAIAARIISAIIDIRRFKTAPKLKKFMGAHVLPDGTFPRRRRGAVADWHPDPRQALYLLADQFVKKPGSEWGMKLNDYKKKFREKHPEVCIQVKASDLGMEPLPEGAQDYVLSEGHLVPVPLSEGSVSSTETSGINETDETTEKEVVGKKPIQYVLIPIGPSPQKKKAKYSVKHPVTGEEITVKGSQKYNDGHIHKMAIWRTITKWVEWLHREWWKLENNARKANLSSSGDGEQTQKAA